MMMTANDVFRTLHEPSKGLYKEKGSRFIGLAFPVENETEVRLILDNTRKEYHNAHHHCYAYALGIKREHYRFSDDGEPAGTAGRPIYGQILNHDLTNILIVVVRFFGGIKLGTRGLIDAYRAAAADAIANAAVVEKPVEDTLEIIFNYQQMGEVMHIFNEEAIDPDLFDHSDQCRIIFRVRRSRANEIEQHLKKVKTLTFKHKNNH